MLRKSLVVIDAIPHFSELDNSKNAGKVSLFCVISCFDDYNMFILAEFTKEVANTEKNVTIIWQYSLQCAAHLGCYQWHSRVALKGIGSVVRRFSHKE